MLMTSFRCWWPKFLPPTLIHSHQQRYHQHQCNRSSWQKSGQWGPVQSRFALRLLVNMCFAGYAYVTPSVTEYQNIIWFWPCTLIFRMFLLFLTKAQFWILRALPSRDFKPAELHSLPFQRMTLNSHLWFSHLVNDFTEWDQIIDWW